MPSRRETLALFAAAASVPAALAREAQAQQVKKPVAVAPEVGPQMAIVSRHLQWTSADEGIEVAKAAGFAGIAWTVRGGAHVEVANVKKELPRIVERTRKAGLTVPMIITAVGDANAEGLEDILGTMQSLGIRRYRAVTTRYDYAKDFDPQYASFRGKLDALAKINERYDTVAMFHTHSRTMGIGGGAWDLWWCMRDMDPRYTGINFDIGHVTAKGGAGWREALCAAHKHVQALSVKDFVWKRVENPQPGAWGWETDFLPPGQGMVNFADTFKYLKSIAFKNPIETYFEYKAPMPGGGQMDMLGTDFGKWKLEIPKAQFAGYLKRDVDFYKTHMRNAGFAV